MKTPEEYAKELIDKHYEVRNSDGYCRFTFHEAKQCAIIDVTHTLEALNGLTSGNYTNELLTQDLNYYNEVLTILKTK